MPDDRALVLLLLGMLAYRSIDLGATKAKLDQAMSKAGRAVKRLPDGTSPSKFIPAYRSFAKRLNVREFQDFVVWYRAARFFSREFLFLLMIACILVLFLLGSALIATHANRPENLSRNILAVTTLVVSSLVSVVTLLLERFRVRLEKV